MASGILRVTPEVLLSTANSFEGSASKIQSLTSQMTELVAGLTGQVWSGEAATAYVTKFNGLQDDMDRIYKMVKEHVDDLTSMESVYSTAEKENEELASSLSEDVIV